MLIINIHKSRAVTFYLIKHRILIRKRFLSILSMHVTYYRSFERLMGLSIINEFLKRDVISMMLDVHFSNGMFRIEE